MQFVSTRQESQPVDFKTALIHGLAPDGGLYLPSSCPQIPYSSLQVSNYPTFASEVLSHWIADEIGGESLVSICNDAFDFEIRLIPLSGANWLDCYVLELFHGPTLSFKDFGARFMARVMAGMSSTEGYSTTILVATSGDTGSAVAHAFSGLRDIRVILLYPKGQISAIQEQQLIVERPGVTACRVDGTFDDCQKLVKSAFEAGRESPTRLSSANSINICRLLPQSVYYAWAARMLEAEPTFCVPSGNLGNLTGGALAVRSGLVVSGFMAAHNANSFFPEYLNDDTTPTRRSVRTLSNAMDVGAPSNLERLTALFSPEELRKLITGTAVTDSETISTMKILADETDYIADPHTAVALQGVQRLRKERKLDGPVVALSTADPAKFADSVKVATGRELSTSEILSVLAHRKTSVVDIPVAQDALQSIMNEST
ncbi:MAG: threonine synthase [Rhodothermia bacterium]|nr:MAG: threonine synthase [Rhodothermia bacterium]